MEDKGNDQPAIISASGRNKNKIESASDYFILLWTNLVVACMAVLILVLSAYMVYINYM